MSRPQKNVQNILNESIIITANHLFQTGLQVLPLVEDVQQEALTLVLDIACMVHKTQRSFLRRDIGNRSLVHICLRLNHSG